jgi:hypothetical protein
MKTHVLKGSKQDIVDMLVRISGDVREAIVFEDEPALSAPSVPKIEDFFAEMHPFMVDVQELDDSREAIYTQMADE